MKQGAERESRGFGGAGYLLGFLIGFLAGGAVFYITKNIVIAIAAGTPIGTSLGVAFEKKIVEKKQIVRKSKIMYVIFWVGGVLLIELLIISKII